jgi:hypothetical protein
LVFDNSAADRPELHPDIFWRTLVQVLTVECSWVWKVVMAATASSKGLLDIDLFAGDNSGPPPSEVTQAKPDGLVIFF